jgi:hypothetical protein
MIDLNLLVSIADCFETIWAGWSELLLFFPVHAPAGLIGGSQHPICSMSDRHGGFRMQSGGPPAVC